MVNQQAIRLVQVGIAESDFLIGFGDGIKGHAGQVAIRRQRNCVGSDEAVSAATIVRALQLESDRVALWQIIGGVNAHDCDSGAADAGRDVYAQRADVWAGAAGRPEIEVFLRDVVYGVIRLFTSVRAAAIRLVSGNRVAGAQHIGQDGQQGHVGNAAGAGACARGGEQDVVGLILRIGRGGDR